MSFQDTVAQLVPVTGGLSAVVYLLWRILNRDRSFDQINAALIAENVRLTNAALSVSGRADQLENDLAARIEAKQVFEAMAAAALERVRMLLRAAELCRCGAMDPVVRLIPEGDLDASNYDGRYNGSSNPD